MVELDGRRQQHLYLAEGRCDGVISGRFRGANAPLRPVLDVAELVWGPIDD